MMRALWSGVSGLKNHQTRMDVIGNNIANVNTVGYKTSRVTFQDMLSQTMQGSSSPSGNVGGTNAIQIGMGMAVASVDTIFTDGSLQSTGKQTDLAISGQGFFQLSNDNGVTKTYTRDGAFDFDTEGNYIMPGTGYKVMGYQIDSTGTASSVATPIKIDKTALMPGKTSTTLTYSGNLLDSATASTAATALTSATVANTAAATEAAVVGATAASVAAAVAAATGVSAADIQVATDAAAVVGADAASVAAAVAASLATATTASTVLSSARQANAAAAGAAAITSPAATAASVLAAVNADPNVSAADKAVAAAAAAATTPVATAASVAEAMATNLSTITTAAGATSAVSTSLKVYASSGTAYNVNGTFEKTGANTWTFTPIGTITDDTGATIANVTTTPATPVTINFDASGAFVSSTADYKMTITPVVPPAAAAGPASFDIIPDFSTMTQYDSASTAMASATDGYGAGSLDKLTISSTGMFIGTYTNGVTKNLAQVALYSFNNPGGLEKVGGNMYVESNNSGLARQDQTSTMSSGSLEMSNVDLAQQFSDMIITQRGFQANSKIITTTDTMLEELVNLKR